MPELIAERKVPVINLVRDAGIAPGTAYRLANPKACEHITGMSFDVLTKLCNYFNVPSWAVIQYSPIEKVVTGE